MYCMYCFSPLWGQTVTVRKQLTGTPASGCLKASGVSIENAGLNAGLIFHGITAMLDLPGLVAFYTKPSGI